MIQLSSSSRFWLSGSHFSLAGSSKSKQVTPGDDLESLICSLSYTSWERLPQDRYWGRILWREAKLQSTGEALQSFMREGGLAPQRALH